MKIYTLPEVFCGLAERPRRGWVMRGVENPESTYDHSYEMAEMVEEHRRCLSRRGDVILARELCICHDLSDFSAQDVTPHDGCSAKRKAQIEQSGIKVMFGKTLPYPTGTTAAAGAPAGGERTFGGGWQDAVVQSVLLWHGFERRLWPVTHFVKQLDQLQMARQTLRYEVSQDKCMPEMWDHVAQRLHEPCLVREFVRLKKSRPRDIERRERTALQKLTCEDELAACVAGVAAVSDAKRQTIVAEREAAWMQHYPVLSDVGSRMRARMIESRLTRAMVLGR